MFGLVKKFLGQNSKLAAKSRLQFVLVQDRAGLTNEELAKFKSEMIAVIEKYFVIDESGFDISYQRDPDSTTLLINSPIIVKRQELPRVVAKAPKGKAKPEAAQEITPENVTEEKDAVEGEQQNNSSVQNS